MSLGIFIPGILVSGIRDFFESRDFYPRDSGIFIPRIGIFSLDGISRQKATSGNLTLNFTYILAQDLNVGLLDNCIVLQTVCLSAKIDWQVLG